MNPFAGFRNVLTVMRSTIAPPVIIKAALTLPFLKILITVGLFNISFCLWFRTVNFTFLNIHRLQIQDDESDLQFLILSKQTSFQ